MIAPGKIRDPFAVSRSYFYPYSLDVDAMQQAAQYFIGKKDFAAVRSVGTPVKSTVREIFTCSADAVGALVRIRVSADGFLYTPVRENSVRKTSRAFWRAVTASRPARHSRRRDCT